MSEQTCVHRETFALLHRLFVKEHPEWFDEAHYKEPTLAEIAEQRKERIKELEAEIAAMKGKTRRK